jgi:hypothetical protein
MAWQAVVLAVFAARKLGIASQALRSSASPFMLASLVGAMLNPTHNTVFTLDHGSSSQLIVFLYFMFYFGRKLWFVEAAWLLR